MPRSPAVYALVDRGVSRAPLHRRFQSIPQGYYEAAALDGASEASVGLLTSLVRYNLAVDDSRTWVSSSSNSFKIRQVYLLTLGGRI